MKKVNFFAIDQPAGRFYVSKINAEYIIPISQSNMRTPYNSEGIQRKINQSRVIEIAKYCEIEDAMFPTPIILSGKSEYFKFYDNEEKEISNENFFDLNDGYIEINTEKIIKDKQYLSIVDGQHRLAGLDISGKGYKFDLIVMFVFDTESYQDAEIFTVINRNQRQVSKSLVYDLYGLTDEITVEKFSHEIVKEMNNRNDSLMKNRIKMLGYKTDNFKKNNDIQIVSQATIVDQIIPLISKNTQIDNKLLKDGDILEIGGGKEVLRNLFIEDKLEKTQDCIIGYMNAWIINLKEYQLDSTIMFKTVGFIAAFKLFQRILMDNISIIDEENYQEVFYYILRDMPFEKINPREISSSYSGANYIVKSLID
ncbi:DGQHR domain-containing protein [Macrococcoides caseolyticum]|uniref:DGQHR domain-containing protein n=1 Tax=Macrococcoides caseolyticum TaxID=69966 RepID=UPI00119EBB03|nr:DGQHR domain-containing protein [Macrococcus caseolyticus]